MLSVRVMLGSGVAGYPLHRRKEDPGATQSHDGHRRALGGHRTSLRRGEGAANQVALAIDTTGSSAIPVGEKLEPLGEYTSLRRIATRARGNP